MSSSSISFFALHGRLEDSSDIELFLIFGPWAHIKVKVGIQDVI